MTDSPKHSELITELAELRRQQLEASTHATYVGWTSETIAAHEQRADRIAVLLAQLATFGAG